jgi:hypothetical protein
LAIRKSGIGRLGDVFTPPMNMDEHSTATSSAPEWLHAAFGSVSNNQKRNSLGQGSLRRYPRILDGPGPAP